ncbi:hypothetical protein GQ602_005455 [Ophiocordyceps camponoti-floridani]|uniref:Uncharacterized protein n=1 Tax=Ophiocordyceps camponoti-floridani TaxID=2030778 RepID=A0A8H4VBZ5_9HYPO|nr:hypothetical protein GQ602_005455 [Ophiocordyceps camponoti-floridani]
MPLLMREETRLKNMNSQMVNSFVTDPDAELEPIRVPSTGHFLTEDPMTINKLAQLSEEETRALLRLMEATEFENKPADELATRLEYVYGLKRWIAVEEEDEGFQ